MTDIVPVPEGVHSTEFPTNADRTAGTFNPKVVAWGDSTRAQSVRDREIALTAYTNAVAAYEAALAAGESQEQAAASALAAFNEANRSEIEATRSEAGAASAWAAAAAAGAAAGLPSMVGKAGMFLAVNATGNGVEWAAGGLEVGGAYVGFRKPQAGVFLDPGSIYLKASYPELASMVPTVSDGTFAAVARTLPASILWQSVAYGNGVFVAVGTAAGTAATTVCATSVDGVSWTQRALPSAVWRQIFFADGKFVALASGGIGATSPDGINWTQRVIPSATWAQVTYGNGLFVAISAENTATNIYTSPDGIAWTQRTAPVAFIGEGVCFGNGIFVATGWTGAPRGYLFTSVDGVTWVERALPNNVTRRGKVAYGYGVFVVLPASAALYNEALVSPDGISWSPATLPATGNWSEIAYGNGIFVAITSASGGTNTCATSRDGFSWTLRALPSSVRWSSISFGPDIFGAVAYGISGAAGNAAASIKVFQYDSATQFFLPRPLDAFGGAKQWVKAA